MSKWHTIPLFLLAALAAAACSVNNPTPTQSPSPTLAPTAPSTTVPDDVADNAYYRCGGEVGYKLVELTDLIAETPFADSTLCPALQAWQEGLTAIRAQHEGCPVPISTGLLSARDSADNALEKIAEALFYLTEYCGSEKSGGEEYWDACLNAVLEAQFHMAETSRAFEVFIAGDITAPHGTNVPSSDYTIYTNSSLRFSAEYPADWEVEVEENRDPVTGGIQIGTMVLFHSREPDLETEIGMQVTVQETAGAIRLLPEELPTDEEYFQIVDDWVAVQPVEIVDGPTIIQVDGYNAVEIALRGTGEDLSYGLVANAAFIVVEDRVFYIEAGGEAEHAEQIQRLYEHLIASFDVLPLR
ncbi:MAG TPA: PsbP-related protein [Anaerolineae bacterium]|nr:PsbP-related protein [Anaerolineae bacterium]